MTGARERAEEALTRFRDRLLCRIRWMMGDHARGVDDSEDLLGEVEVRVLEQAPSLVWRDGEHFLALATRIARNAIVDRVRRPRLRRLESLTASLQGGDLVTSSRPSPSQDAARGEDLERVLGALELLGDEDQRVIELRHLEGLPFRAIGERMGRSEAAAQMLHARAVTRLGRLLRG